jgi:hypothetical protein
MIQGTCKVFIRMNLRQSLGQKVKLFLRLKKVKVINQGVERVKKAVARNPKQRRATVKTLNPTSMTVNQPIRALNRRSSK